MRGYGGAGVGSGEAAAGAHGAGTGWVRLCEAAFAGTMKGNGRMAAATPTRLPTAAPHSHTPEFVLRDMAMARIFLSMVLVAAVKQPSR
jgi:hypothetical protein